MDRGAPSETELTVVGDSFRRERIRRGIKLSQAANETKIRPALLAVIEAGSIEDLPTAVFAKGLIRTYARYLGVDPRPYLVTYAAMVPEAVASVVAESQTGASRRSGSSAGILFPAIVVGALLLLGGYLYQQYAAFVSGPLPVAARPLGDFILLSTPLPSPPAAVVRAVATPNTSASPPLPTSSPPTPLATVLVTPTAPPSPTASPIQGVHIDAVAVARVWVQVEGDGKVIFAGILNAGDRKSWNATQKIMVWSGNASSLNVTFNGKPVGSLGPPGEVVKVTWTATS